MYLTGRKECLDLEEIIPSLTEITNPMLFNFTLSAEFSEYLTNFDNF